MNTSFQIILVYYIYLLNWSLSLRCKKKNIWYKNQKFGKKNIFFLKRGKLMALFSWRGGNKNKSSTWNNKNDSKSTYIRINLGGPLGGIYIAGSGSLEYLWISCRRLLPLVTRAVDSRWLWDLCGGTARDGGERTAHIQTHTHMHMHMHMKIIIAQQDWRVLKLKTKRRSKKKKKNARPSRWKLGPKLWQTKLMGWRLVES